MADNTLSLVTGSVLSMIIGTGVVAISARYFGPEGLGQINYAVAFVSMFVVLGSLNMDSIVMRSLVGTTDNQVEGLVLGSAFALRLTGGALVVLFAGGLSFLLDDQDHVSLILVLFMSTATALRAFEVLDAWVNAHLRARLFTTVRLTVTLLVAGLKVLVMLLHGDLLLYGALYVFDALIAGLAAFVIYRRVRSPEVRWRFDHRMARKLLRESLPLIGSGLLISVTSRLDQVMLGVMLDKEAVGIYTAAVILAELWYFIPIALINSMKGAFFAFRQPKESRRDSSYETLLRVVAVASVSLALIVSLTAPQLIGVVYGPQFNQASSLLRFLPWAGVLSMMGMVRSLWLVKSGLQRYSVLYSLAACAASLLLNLLLIPRVGLFGAALSRIGVQVVSFVVPLMLSATRDVTISMIRAFSPREALLAVRPVAESLHSAWRMKRNGDENRKGGARK